MRIQRVASVGVLLLASAACSDDPSPETGGAAGSAAAAGHGGAPSAGSGGKASAGSGGKASAGAGGAPSAGAGGAPPAGSGGAPAGSGGTTSAGGKTSAGTGGAPPAGAGGAPTAGSAGSPPAGAGGTAAGGGGGPPAGASGASGASAAGGSGGASGAGGKSAGGQGGSGGSGGSGGAAGQGGAGSGGGSSGQSGGGQAGSAGGTSAPAWWAKGPVGGFVEIPGTNNCGVVANAYSGFTLKLDSAEIFFLAVGGHSDSSDNRVVSLGLLADAPTWTLRNAPSTHPIEDAGYYDDGDGTPKKPGSTHTYDYTAWVPQAAGGAGRLMRYGMFGTWPHGFGANNIDGFDPVTNTWDPPGTYPDVPGSPGTPSNAGTVVDRDTGTVYAANGSKRLALGGTTWEDATLHTARFPNAWDSKRHALFGLQWADGQGYGEPVLTAVLNVPSTGVSTPIKLAPSEALTQFLADKPAYAGMDYDPILDKFLFYAAQDSAENKTPERIYAITPSDGSSWTIDFFKLAAGSAKPSPVPGAGVQGRFKYVPQLRGFVLLPEQHSNLFFLRTAE